MDNLQDLKNLDLFNADADNKAKIEPVTIALGVGSLLAGIFSSVYSNESNKSLMREQNRFNERMMDKQNEYNSPYNQKKLYNAAGINPAFLFGGQSGLDSTSGMATASSTPTMQGYDMSPAEALFKTKELENQTMQAEANADKALSESESFKIANSFAKERNRAEIDAIKSQKGLSDADRELRIAQKETELQRKEEVFRNAESLRYYAELLRQRGESEGWNTKRMQLEYEKLYKFMPVELEALKAKYNLDNAQAEVAKKTLEDIDSQISKRVKEGELIDAKVVGNIIDNVVKDAKANPEIIEAMIRADNPLEFITLEHTNGIFQNAYAESFGLRLNYKDNYNNFGSYKNRAKLYKFNHYNSGSSYLFSK